MTIDTLIMLTGAFVAALPFLGFPHNWDSVFYFLAGVVVIALGIVVRRTSARELPRQSREPNFVESQPSDEETAA